MAEIKYTTEVYNELLERVFNGSIDAAYELDRYVNKCEEFVKNSPVYCCGFTALPVSHLKTFEALHALLKRLVPSLTRLFVFYSDNTYYIRFAFCVGQNGRGDWMKNDLLMALRVLQDLRSKTKAAEFTEMHHDIPDDVSYWGVALEI